jgi:hypothetical protein
MDHETKLYLDCLWPLAPMPWYWHVWNWIVKVTGNG